jgi:lambda family phage minor tail protein L
MSESTSNLSKQMLSIAPDALIELFEIDFSILQQNVENLGLASDINFGDSSVYRFCAMINGSNPIYWQGNGYQPLPIEAEGFEKTGDGRLPRPKLRIANPDGLFSLIFRLNKDFANCRITRKRTFAKFLDADNYLNRNTNSSGDNHFGAPDPDAHFPDDIFYINKKITESKNFLEFELVSALELENSYVPSRVVMSSYCNWTYRCDIGCGYKGLPIETSDGIDLTKGFAESDKDSSMGQIDSSIQSVNEIPQWSKYGMNGSESAPEGYDLGDMVKIVGSHSSNPYRSTPQVFVCIQSHQDPKEHHPFFDKKYWLQDECQKTLGSCTLRFSQSEALVAYNKSDQTHEGLRFGGFPGTENFPVEG